MDLAIAELKITPDIDSSTVTIETFTDSIAGGDLYAVRLTVKKSGKTVGEAMSRINGKPPC